MVLRVLNVAEKPSVARAVSQILSEGSMRTRDGRSVYNKIFEFEYNIAGQGCFMSVTSVTGHLMELAFEDRFRKWTSCDPADLYHAPVRKLVPPDKLPLQRTLQEEARRCSWLILWLDCDREGENIAFEVMEICCASNPHLNVWRARFSALIHRDIHHAAQNLIRPNRLFADAVDARQEIDLRIGASFTRFQTMLLGDSFIFPFAENDKKLVLSYGPCQFPTLGFVVERFWEIQAHQPEDFWIIKCQYSSDEGNANFSWNRFLNFCSAHWLKLQLQYSDLEFLIVAGVRYKLLPRLLRLRLFGSMAASASVLGTTQDAPRPITWTYELTPEDETEMQTAIEHFSGRTLVGRLVGTTPSRPTVREWIESALGGSTARILELSMMSAGLFLLQLSDLVSTDALLARSPISFGSRLLVFQRWTPQFDQDEFDCQQQIPRFPVTLSFPSLPIFMRRCLPRMAARWGIVIPGSLVSEIGTPRIQVYAPGDTQFPDLVHIRDRAGQIRAQRMVVTGACCTGACCNSLDGACCNSMDEKLSDWGDWGGVELVEKEGRGNGAGGLLLGTKD
ncbi:hypothetical protein L7F22_025504 [Adiantum nelumboides]|nr:hypothetical protein [Adiantum nelumboides]